MNSRPAIKAIILSAGISSRLGQFKPLLPLGQKTILEHVLSLYSSAGITDIRVVVGYRADAVIPVIRSIGAVPIVNPAYTHGMFSSVVAGISELPLPCDAFFIHPVDIPLVRLRTITDLLKAFGNRTKDGIYYPAFMGKRGHPPLIPGMYVDSIRAWSGQEGLGGFLCELESDAVEIPVADQYILNDIDLPADYEWALNCIENYDIPSVDECRELMKAAPDRVCRHCQTVANLAERMGKALNTTGCSLNIELITAAAMVHDLARVRPDHAAAGAHILREMLFPRVADIVEIHMDFPSREKAPVKTRFAAGLQRYRTRPDICQNIIRRMQQAIESQQRIEALLGYSVHQLQHSASAE